MSTVQTDRRTDCRHAAFCLATTIFITTKLINHRNRWNLGFPPNRGDIVYKEMSCQDHDADTTRSFELGRCRSSGRPAGPSLRFSTAEAGSTLGPMPGREPTGGYPEKCLAMTASRSPGGSGTNSWWVRVAATCSPI